jgi:hypothetical protein
MSRYLEGRNHTSGAKLNEKKKERGKEVVTTRKAEKG